MSYIINRKGQIFFGNTLVIMDESDPTYIDYKSFLESGGTVIESNDPNEIILDQIELLRIAYSRRISEIPGMQEAVERFAIDGTLIPQNIVDKREELKTEYHEAINQITN
jgi:hypothetical protein